MHCANKIIILLHQSKYYIIGQKLFDFGLLVCQIQYLSLSYIYTASSLLLKLINFEDSAPSTWHDPANNGERERERERERESAQCCDVKEKQQQQQK